MSNQKPPKVFVSHSASDRAFVEREIIAPMQRQDLDTWYSEDNIATAEEWEKAIRQALKSCEWFLVAVSPNSVESQWVKAEVRWALDNRPGKVIPVMIETCDLGDMHLKLPLLQYIDFRKDKTRAKDELLAVWDLGPIPQARLLYQKAREMIAAASWSEAEELLEEVISLDSKHTGAPGVLDYVRERRTLAEQYEKSIAALDKGDWDEAIKALETVTGIDNSYRDAARLLRQTHRLKKEKGESEARVKKEAAAAAKLDTIRSSDLIRQFHNAALEAIKREDWATARQQLENARTLDAHNEENESLRADLGRRERWAQAYSHGEDLILGQQWVLALKTFHQLREEAGDYKETAYHIAQIENELREQAPPAPVTEPLWRKLDPRKRPVAAASVAAGIIGVLVLAFAVWVSTSDNQNRPAAFSGSGEPSSGRKASEDASGERPSKTAGGWDTTVLPAPSFSGQTLHPSSGGSKFPRLEQAASQTSQVGESQWFERNGVEWPIYQLPGDSSALNPSAPALPGFVPREYAGARIIKAIRQRDRIVLVYGANYAEGRYLVALNQEGKFVYGFDLANFAHPPGTSAESYQSTVWAIEDGEALYVLTAHLGYARNTNGMNAYITAIDLRSKDVIWRSQPLVANSRNFQVIEDAIVCGYGFADEADYLYILDKRTGAVRERQPLPSGPQFIMRKDNTLLVRASGKDISYRMAF